MGIRAVVKRLLAPEDPAITAHELVVKRLDALEEAFGELAGSCEDVISKVRSWSAREAAKKRHEAARNLDEIMQGDTEGGGDIVDPGASSSHEDREAAARAARKAEIARRFRRGA